jgi:RNA polymerase sigma-70 factor, ECF subfamily
VRSSPGVGGPAGGVGGQAGAGGGQAGAGGGGAEEAVTAAFREEWARIVATLIGWLGDWDLAEECAQEAFAAALPAWRRDGVPDSPRAWLTTTARNRAVDRIRRARRGEVKERALAIDGTAELDVDLDALDSGIADERLRLLYTCCHPALSFESRVTLALRTLCGLSTAEIARAFGVPEATMAKRLVRTKRKIAVAGIPYRVPPAHLLPERTAAVLNVIYLLFHEGYAATSGPELIRAGLCAHAVELAGMTADLMPDHPEAAGLFALLVLLHARRDGRVDADGVLVPLEEQDRSRWDRAAIAAGVAAIQRAVRRERIGPYQLQALIAASHATAPDAAATDWARIAGLYDLLLAQVPSPAVRLNRAIAIAMRDGPRAGLELLDEVDDHPLLAATVADLLRRLDRRAEAAAWYRKALARTANDSERRYLTRRLTALGPAD